MGDPELSKFKTEIDLRLFAASQGYELDPKESWSSSAVMRHPNNDKIVITRNAADGHYVYFSFRDEADNGTIIDFIQRRLGLSLGATRVELRAFMGLPAPSLAPYPALARVAKDRIRVERAFSRMEAAESHPYLEKDRAIPPGLLSSKRFRGRIRIDVPHGNAIFPHFDSDGLCGFEIRNREFKGFSTGGSKGLWTGHSEPDDNRIVFFEGTIDALSYAALFPDAHARYASLGGKPSPLQRELVRAAAAAMPASSTVVAAMDADKSGRELAEVIKEAVKLTGRSDLRFEMQEPQGAKDWNDLLRGKSKMTLAARREEPRVA
jgi:hypothetical protein